LSDLLQLIAKTESQLLRLKRIDFVENLPNLVLESIWKSETTLLLPTAPAPSPAPTSSSSPPALAPALLTSNSLQDCFSARAVAQQARRSHP